MSGIALISSGVADQQHVLQSRAATSRSSATLRLYSAAVVTSTRPSPRLIRWRIGSGPKAENSGQKTLPSFQRAERADVKLGNAPGQQEHALSPGDAEPSQHIGEAVGQRTQIGIGEIAGLAALPEPSQRQMIAQRSRGVAIHGLVRDVQSASAGKTVELAPRVVPGK